MEEENATQTQSLMQTYFLLKSKWLDAK